MAFFKSFFSTTVWGLWLMVLVTAGLMILQMFTAIALPHIIAAQLLIAVATGYTGSDRLAQFIKTKEMPVGTGDLGDVKKLRGVLFLLLLVFIEALVLTVFFAVPGLSLDMLLVAFGSTAASFVIGNKGVSAAISMTPTKTTTIIPVSRSLDLPIVPTSEVGK